MKKQTQPILLLFCVMMLLVGCNTSTKKEAVTPVSAAAVIEVVSPKAMKGLLDNTNNAQLVDVRRSDEYQVSHLKEAQNICVTDSDFREKAKSLDPQKPVYVYCKKGGRSAKAASILKEMGFTQIYDLQGGITNWESQQLEVSQ